MFFFNKAKKDGFLHSGQFDSAVEFMEASALGEVDFEVSGINKDGIIPIANNASPKINGIQGVRAINMDDIDGAIMAANRPMHSP